MVVVEMLLSSNNRFLMFLGITVDRPRIPMTLNRQQIIVQGVVGNSTLVSPTGSRTVIPARMASGPALSVVGYV